MAVENGIIFKGRQVVIPKTSQKQILQQLHSSHQGIAKTQMLARESVYWPGINKDIENTIKNCATCQKYMPMQASEPSLHHNIPPMPWRKLASDLYQIGTSNYLIIIDYFSKFPLVVEMNSTTSQSIINYYSFFQFLEGPKNLYRTTARSSAAGSLPSLLKLGISSTRQAVPTTRNQTALQKGLYKQQKR